MRINAEGLGATNTITRAELVAILAALQQMKDETHETIATDSQASMFMIHRHLNDPHKLGECKHKEILQKIVDLLLKRAAQDASKGDLSEDPKFPKDKSQKERDAIELLEKSLSIDSSLVKKVT